MERGGRSMPKRAVVAAHWGVDADTCVRCGADGVMHRAHLIDRMYGGLDGPQNLVLLCAPCHAAMPSFAAGDERRALKWVQSSENAYYEWAGQQMRAQRPQDFLAAMMGQLSADDFVELEFDWTLAPLPPGERRLDEMLAA